MTDSPVSVITGWMELAGGSSKPGYLTWAHRVERYSATSFWAVFRIGVAELRRGYVSRGRVRPVEGLRSAGWGSVMVSGFRGLRMAYNGLWVLQGSSTVREVGDGEEGCSAAGLVCV